MDGSFVNHENYKILKFSNKSKFTFTNVNNKNNKYFGAGLCANANYMVNIIEKLSGSERDDNGLPFHGIIVDRQKWEEIDSQPSNCPYGLHDRLGNEYTAERDRRVAGNKFLPYKILALRLYVMVQIILTLRSNLIILSWTIFF